MCMAIFFLFKLLAKIGWFLFSHVILRHWLLSATGRDRARRRAASQASALHQDAAPGTHQEGVRVHRQRLAREEDDLRLLGGNYDSVSGLRSNPLLDWPECSYRGVFGQRPRIRSRPTGC